jgi:chromate transport protein ChrA
MRPVMTGMIGAAALMFLNRETFVDWVSIVIFSVSFFAIWKKFNPILLLIIAAVAGIIIY